MDATERVLVGTALGDALGLPWEGMGLLSPLDARLRAPGPPLGWWELFRTNMVILPVSIVHLIVRRFASGLAWP